MHTPASLPASTPAIRLYAPTALTPDASGTWPAAPPLSSSLTLGEFYRAFIRPVVLRGSRPRNLEQYDDTIAKWEALSTNPAIHSITDLVAAEWLTRLESQPGKTKGSTITPTSIHKHCRTLQRCLDLTGPRSRATPRLRHAQHLIDQVPYLDKPALKRSKRTQGVFTLEEIAAQIAAAPRMRVPRQLQPRERAIFWRSVILLDYNCPLRIGTLCELRWQWINGEWLEIPAGGDFYKGGDEHRFWLNTYARKAIADLRPITGSFERIFPWLDWYSHITHVHRQHRRLRQLAGLDPNRQFGFKGFRKRSLSEHARIDRKAAQLAGGHTNERTTDTYYITGEVDDQHLISASSRLPQPPEAQPAENQPPES